MDAPFNFEIVDWVVLDDRHAAFERCDPTTFKHSTHHRIEREKQAPSLPRHGVTKIHANVRIGIEREEPVIRKVDAS